MEFNLSTPALLFSAISLLMLAYTNRFLTIANLIRELHSRYEKDPKETTKGQIENLRTRVNIIILAQLMGVLSFFFCVVSMFAIFANYHDAGKVIFGISLVLLMVSLALLLVEIFISAGALYILLSDFDGKKKND